MLDLRWLFALVLVGCTSSPDDGATADEDPRASRDARVQSMKDASDASFDAPQLQDAAQVDASDARAPTMRSWMDVPAGPAPMPREVCARSWRVPGRPVISGFGTIPNARFTASTIDDEGNTLVAGFLVGSFDFGTGELSVPELKSGAFLLKLDGACNVLWSRLFTPGARQTERYPGALGFDAQQHLVLVTSSRDGNANYSGALTTPAASGDVVAEKILAIGANPPGTAFASRDGHVMFSGIAYTNASDFGGGPLSDVNGGQQYNVLLRSDGTFVRQQLLGSANPPQQAGQSLLPSGGVLAWGSDVEGYYGTPLVGPTVAKVTPEGTIAWKTALYGPQTPTLDWIQADAAEDGSIAVWTWHGYEGETVADARFRELGPEGSMRWDVPIKRDGFLSLHQLRAATGSVAAAGGITGTLRIGHTSVVSGSGANNGVVLQLDRGGAVRWAINLSEEWVDTLDINPRDEVVVSGYGSGDVELPIFVRVYGSGVVDSF